MRNGNITIRWNQDSTNKQLFWLICRILCHSKKLNATDPPICKQRCSMFSEKQSNPLGVLKKLIWIEIGIFLKITVKLNYQMFPRFPSIVFPKQYQLSFLILGKENHGDKRNKILALLFPCILQNYVFKFCITKPNPKWFYINFEQVFDNQEF